MDEGIKEFEGMMDKWHIILGFGEYDEKSDGFSVLKCSFCEIPMTNGLRIIVDGFDALEGISDGWYMSEVLGGVSLKMGMTTEMILKLKEMGSLKLKTDHVRVDLMTQLKLWLMADAMLKMWMLLWLHL